MPFLCPLGTAPPSFHEKALKLCSLYTAVPLSYSLPSVSGKPPSVPVILERAPCIPLHHKSNIMLYTRLIIFIPIPRTSSGSILFLLISEIVPSFSWVYKPEAWESVSILSLLQAYSIYWPGQKVRSGFSVNIIVLKIFWRRTYTFKKLRYNKLYIFRVYNLICKIYIYTVITIKMLNITIILNYPSYSSVISSLLPLLPHHPINH